MTYNDICNAPNHAGIYCFRNKVNNKYYIGQALKLRTRLKAHWRNILNNASEMILYKAIAKYGTENFELKIIHEIHDALAYNTKDMLDSLEKEYIQKYNSYLDGYNSTLGGDGGILGYKMTEAQIQKIRQNSLQRQEALREEAAQDKQNWIKCYNIQTQEEFIFPSRRAVSISLELPEYIIKMCLLGKIHLGAKKWQIAGYTQEYENIPKWGTEDFDDWYNTKYKELVDKQEICQYIQENPTCLYGEIKQYYNLSKATFYNYKKELGITSEFRNDSKVSKKDFLDFQKEHSKKECLEHFKISERTYNTYLSKYTNK